MDELDRLEELFEEALARTDPAERERFLTERCAGDPDLRAEIDELLEQDGRSGLLDALPQSFAAEPEVGAPPTQIGQYRIVQRIGAGGGGVVYLAEQQTPRRRVALKILATPTFSAKLRQRFDFEVAFLGRLQHPGIAQIFEAGTFPSRRGREPFFAMEYVNGSTLLRAVEERKLGVPAKLALFASICDAVQHAHQHGVVHRDLKPGNILVDPSGQPKILDFGIARSTDSDLKATVSTAEGLVIGTLAYMSPEQAAGDPRAIDARTDVYALGVILYELLTGELPHAVTDHLLHEAVRKIREDEPTPPSRRDRSLRGDLETIVLKALEKDKERRYPSAEALGEDVRRFVSHQPIRARPASSVYQLRKLARRHRALVTGVVATILALVVGLLVAVTFSIQSDRLRRQQQAQAAILSAGMRLSELGQELPLLWPRRPSMVPRMEAWLGEAEPLLVAAPDLARAFQEVEGLDRANLRLLERNLEKVQAFTTSGWTEDVRTRRDRARELAQRIEGEDRELWAEAIASIGASPRYAGLQLEPVVGLLPLGPDPLTDLSEFLVLESGEPPLRDPDTGRWEILDDTGIVLVLLPGGAFEMGSDEVRGPRADAGQPHIYQRHTVVLDPFFLAKYEMTQGQWQLATGENPAYLTPARSRFVDRDRPLTHPVELITWEQATRTLWQLGLCLPTEAQWEYAARAGTNGHWWSGEDKASLAVAENLAERTLLRFVPGNLPHEPWEDGFVMHAPVGSLEPNPLGLFDILGNVREYCRDYYSETSYLRHGVNPGDGFRGFDNPGGNYCMRGGCFYEDARSACCEQRYFTGPSDRNMIVGVRPALPLVAPWTVSGAGGNNLPPLASWQAER